MTKVEIFFARSHKIREVNCLINSLVDLFPKSTVMMMIMLGKFLRMFNVNPFLQWKFERIDLSSQEKINSAGSNYTELTGIGM